MFMEWEEGFSVNVDKFDEQHKKLINMINELHDGIVQGRAKALVGDILDQLIDYTEYHFAAEEDLMTLTEYPGKEDHIKEHWDLIYKVKDLKGDFESNERAMNVEVMAFLVKWLTTHISVTDKMYSSHFNDHGVS